MLLEPDVAGAEVAGAEGLDVTSYADRQEVDNTLDMFYCRKVSFSSGSRKKRGLIRATPNPSSPGFRVQGVRDEGKESWGSEEADNSSADEDKEQNLA